MNWALVVTRGKTRSLPRARCHTKYIYEINGVFSLIYLTNLRFADDVLLVETRRSALQDMIQDLMHEASKVGLQMHLGKTKILTNDGRFAEASGSINIGGHQVEIMAGRSATMYLGRNLAIIDSMTTELENRL